MYFENFQNTNVNGMNGIFFIFVLGFIICLYFVLLLKTYNYHITAIALPITKLKNIKK